MGLGTSIRIQRAVKQSMVEIEKKLLEEYRKKQEENQKMLLAKVEEFEALIVKRVKEEVKKQIKP